MAFPRAVVITSLLTILGCLPSLESIYTEKDLIFEPEIVGLWKLENSPQTWAFKKRGEKSYHLVFTDKHGESGRFIAHVCRVEDTLFLDLFPEQKEPDSPAFYKYHLMPLHTVYMVKQTKPALELVSIDIKWLDQHLAEHPDDLTHAKYKNRTLITAPTKELQRFLIKHKDRFTGTLRLRPHSPQETVEVSQ